MRRNRKRNRQTPTKTRSTHTQEKQTGQEKSSTITESIDMAFHRECESVIESDKQQRIKQEQMQSQRQTHQSRYHKTSRGSSRVRQQLEPAITNKRLPDRKQNAEKQRQTKKQENNKANNQRRSSSGEQKKRKQNVIAPLLYLICSVVCYTV